MADYGHKLTGRNFLVGSASFCTKRYILQCGDSSSTFLYRPVIYIDPAAFQALNDL